MILITMASSSNKRVQTLVLPVALAISEPDQPKSLSASETFAVNIGAYIIQYHMLGFLIMNTV